jgi:hypothetical protein
MASIISGINLPTSILFHALGLCGLGLYYTFRPTPLAQKSSSAPLGIATLGLGVAYLATSYMPIAENQWLHASVPVRILLALVAGIRAVMSKPTEDRRHLWTILLYDGLGGLMLGRTLGRWDGRIVGY